MTVLCNIMHVCTGELQRPQSREPTTRKSSSTGRLYCECDLNVLMVLPALCLRNSFNRWGIGNSQVRAYSWQSACKWRMWGVLVAQCLVGPCHCTCMTQENRLEILAICNELLQYIVAGTWRGMDVAIRVTKEKAMNKDGLHFMEQAINILKYVQYMHF